MITNQELDVLESIARRAEKSGVARVHAVDVNCRTLLALLAEVREWREYETKLSLAAIAVDDVRTARAAVARTDREIASANAWAKRALRRCRIENILLRMEKYQPLTKGDAKLVAEMRRDGMLG